MSTFRGTLSGHRYAPAGSLRFWIHGNELAKDLLPFHQAMLNEFPRKAAVPITLGGAKIFRRFVRSEMRPPQYPIKFNEGGGYRRVWAEPYTPSGGYAWYSGTLRRSLGEATFGKVGLSTSAIMSVNRSKGNPPRWQRWNRPRNAQEYARWIEFGQVPGQPRRQIFKRGFDKGKVIVADWMMLQAWAYIRVYAQRGRIARLGKRGATRKF